MSPRNKETNEHMRAESLKKITNAGLKIFSEYGYYGATLKKITEATGLSYGLVYHYFPSKEKIFLYLLDIAFKNSKSILDEALETQGNAWQKIKALSNILVEKAFTEELSLHFIITQQAMTLKVEIPGLTETIQNGLKHYERFDHILIEAQKAGDVIKGDPEILSASYLSLVQGLALVMQHQKNVKNKITPDIFNNLLQNKH